MHNSGMQALTAFPSLSLTKSQASPTWNSESGRHPDTGCTVGVRGNSEAGGPRGLFSHGKFRKKDLRRGRTSVDEGAVSAEAREDDISRSQKSIQEVAGPTGLAEP